MRCRTGRPPSRMPSLAEIFAFNAHRESQTGFTLLEIAVAMAILAVAVGQLFLLFPVGVRLQQKAEDQTHLANLGKHVMNQIRGAVRVDLDEDSDLNGYRCFSSRFIDMKPLDVNAGDFEAKRDLPWDDEIYNRLNDGGTATDVKAGGRGVDKDGEPAPWLILGVKLDNGWVGSPSPLEMLKAVEEYNIAHPDPSDQVAGCGELSSKMSLEDLTQKIMKYRWIALTAGDLAVYPDNPGSGFYDLAALGNLGRDAVKAQNPRLNFEIFKNREDGLSTAERQRMTFLKKISVRVYWDEHPNYNRYEEFVTYVANF